MINCADAAALLLAERILLAGAFFAAGIAKSPLLDRAPSRAPQLRPASIALRALPYVEVGLAVWLVSGVLDAAAAAACLVILTMFSIYILYLARRSPGETCGCFGPFDRSQSVVLHMGRNGVLLAVAGSLLLIPALTQCPSTSMSAGAGLLLGAALLVVVGATYGLLIQIERTFRRWPAAGGGS